MSGSQVYQALGGQGIVTTPFPPVQAPRSPSSSDVVGSNGAPYNLLQQWINTTNSNVYTYLGAGVWILVESAAGDLLTLTDTANTTVTPTAGNIKLSGTANQVTVTAGSSTLTFTLPSTLIAPGSIASTTTITSGTSLTATLGNITATNGNIVRGSAGNKDIYSSVASTTAAGANSAGTVTLVGGTATISTTAVTANSQIRLYRQGIGSTGAAALGTLSRGTITPGVSFVINAVQAVDATALQASDVSVIGWEIVN
jgi:hypothetical protein